MSSSRMGTHLPDEILSEILTPVLRVLDDQFRDTSDFSPFLTYSESSSALLAVSKSWLRVATPLLYNVVVLRSKAQARALERALRGNKLLGTFIRKLRVEGGLGASMFGILERSPGITDVWLSLNLWSSDVVSGLCRGLPTINPRHLILFDSNTLERKINAATRQLVEALDSCIRGWTKMETITVTQRVAVNLNHKYAVLKDAVVAAPSLTTLIFVKSPFSTRLLFQLSQNKSLECIRVVHSTDESDLHRRITMETFQSLEDDLQLLKPHKKPRVPVCIERPDCLGTSLSVPVDQISTKHQTLTSPIVALSLASDAIKEAVFSSIIFHTLTINEIDAIHYYRRFNYFNGRGELSNNQAVPQSIVLVSKLFQNLALQHFYRYTTIFRTVQLEIMAYDIGQNSSLGAQVRSVAFSPREYFRLDTQESLHAIIAHTPNLEKLYRIAASDDEKYVSSLVTPGLNLRILTTLANVAGGSLSTLLGMTFEINDFPTEVLCKFTALKRLEWPSVPTNYGPATISPNSLAHLTYLKYYHASEDSFLRLLSCMELPAIKHLEVHTIEWELVFPGLRRFLKKHGLKLETLTADCSDPCYFSLCRDLKVLNIRYRFEPGFESHANLTKIILFGYRDTYQMEYASKAVFHETFDKLYEVELGELYPALEEIQVYQCVWPTTERELVKGLKGLWVKWSEKLAQWNIKLTDKEGRHWRPRLK